MRIGIALGGPWEGHERIRTTFEREITQLLQAEYDVRFPPEKRLQADWTAAGVEAVVDRLLVDPEVDFVLTLEVLTSNEVAHRGPLPKPVIAPYILGPELQAVPYEIRERRVPGQPEVVRTHVSGVRNLSYVNVQTDLLREVSRFREIVPFSRLKFLTMTAFVEAIPQLADNVVSKLGPLNLELSTVQVCDSFEEALTAIPPDT